MGNIAWVLILVLLGAFMTGVTADVAGRAGRVEALIKQIETAKTGAPGDEPRKAVLDESDINAYIATQIEREKDVLKTLRLKLLDGNLVQGNVVLDLAGLNLLNLLPPRMNLEFKGLLETVDRRGRFKVHTLFLDQQPIQPQVIDMIIAGLAGAYGMQPTSIQDWYELPYGIDKIETINGAATVYY